MTWVFEINTTEVIYNQTVNMADLSYNACAGPSHCVQGAVKYSSFSNRSWVYLKGALEITDT